MHSQQTAPTSNLRFMLRALRYRNYRLFFGGQIVSLVGTWLSMVASSWLVYRLASAEGRPAPFLLGLVAFAGQIPMFLLTPVGRRVGRPLAAAHDPDHHANAVDAAVVHVGGPGAERLDHDLGADRA